MARLTVLSEKLPMPRLQFAVEVVSELAVVAALTGVGLLALQFGGLLLVRDNLFAVVCLPAMAGLAMMLICAVCPGVVAPAQLKAPLQYTLPLVYVALLFLLANLATLQDAPIVALRTLPALRLWRMDAPLFMLLAIQIMWLSVAVYRRNRKPLPAELPQ